ncbi:MAG: hypothetical protein KIT67_27805 [Alphaproteobacteria bacterium]|nr:hypothetical protein [Alphaproteobacteria bacterium]
MDVRCIGACEVPIVRNVVLVVPFIAATLGAGMPAQAQGYGVADDGEGRRSFVWDNGDSFVGEMRNGRPHGHGVFRTAGGEVHEGEWRDGCLVTEDYRVAVFTRLKDCPPAPRPRPRQPPRRGHLR